MTTWLEVSLRVDGEAAEAVAELLQRYGYQGVVISQDDIPPDRYDEGAAPPADHLTVRAYFPVDERTEDTRAQFEAGLSYLNMLYPMPQPTYRTVADEDWSDAWKAHYHPLRLGTKLYIHPLWLEPDAQPGDIIIGLDPGMAFGTGTHPTTQLCLVALEDRTQAGTHVLDLGTGSAILAIAAAKLGAAHVLALDIDPIAVEAARDNVTRNGVADKITVQTGSLASVVTSARRFDLLVVNILARIIIQMCDEGLGAVVRPGGRAVFSGIIADQVDDVEAALLKTGLTPDARRQQGDWVVIEALRPNV